MIYYLNLCDIDIVYHFFQKDFTPPPSCKHGTFENIHGNGASPNLLLGDTSSNACLAIAIVMLDCRDRNFQDRNLNPQNSKQELFFAAMKENGSGQRFWSWFWGSNCSFSMGNELFWGPFSQKLWGLLRGVPPESVERCMTSILSALGLSATWWWMEDDGKSLGFQWFLWTKSVRCFVIVKLWFEMFC